MSTSSRSAVHERVADSHPDDSSHGHAWFVVRGNGGGLREQLLLVDATELPTERGVHEVADLIAAARQVAPRG